jgi:hypothetical protein
MIFQRVSQSSVSVLLCQQWTLTAGRQASAARDNWNNSSLRKEREEASTTLIILLIDDYFDQIIHLEA